MKMACSYNAGVLFIGLLVMASDVRPLDCEKAIATPDINACGQITQKKIETELNAVYRQTLQSLSQSETAFEKPGEVKSALVEAQRAWIKFREADCHAVFLKNQGGTMRSLMYTGCLQAHAEQRIKELKRFPGTN